MARFALHIDERCQRGIHLQYRLHECSPQGALAAVGEAFPQALNAVEALGPRRLHRLIVPFRFELRAGHADGELSMLLRLSATLEQRALDRQAIETLLTSLPEEGATE